MKNKVVKQWIAIITLSCVLTGYIAYDNLTVFHPSNSTYVGTAATPEEQQKLQEEYVSTAMASVKSEIHDEIDDYIVQYVTKNDISNYFNEETITNLTQSVTNTIVSDDSDDGTKAEMEKLIADTVSQIDFTNYQTSQTAALSEDTKALITNEVASAVQEQLQSANFTYTLTDEDKASITSDLNTKVDTLSAQVADILNNTDTKTTTPDSSYTLSDEEMARVNDYVKANLDVSGEVAKYFQSTETGTTLDTEALKAEIANAVTVTLSDQINNIVKGQDGVNGVDGYTPIKGVDYFTDAEVTSMIDEIASRVQNGADGADGKDGEDGYTPVKGVDYFTADEINDIIAQIKAGVQNGADGKDGADGYTPVKGVDYFTDDEVAAIVADIQSKVVNGKDGSDGLSAYELAVEEGFIGSRADWLNSLHGADGYTPVKGTDYFTADEIKDLKDSIVATVSSSYDDIVADIQSQIDDINDEIAANDTAIGTLNDRLQTLSSDLSALDSSNSENTSKISEISSEINSITAQITNLETASDALNQSKLDISSFNEYKTDTANQISTLSDKMTAVTSDLDAYKESVASHFDTIDALIDTMASSDEVDEFKSAYEEFKTNVNNKLGALDTTCTALGNTKLNITDFESYQSEETEKINSIIDNLKENNLLIGDTDFSTEDYSTLTDAVKSIQTEVDSFEDEYGDTTDKLNDDIASINGIIGTKQGVFTDYTGTLWQAADELQAQIKANDSTSDSINAELTAFKTDTNNSLARLGGSISDLQTDLTTKLDTTTFMQYQGTVDATVENLRNSIDTVNTALEEESKTRSTGEAALQANIDATNELLAGETSARKSADTTLQNNINTVSDDLATEVSDRTNADTSLQGNIDSEASVRESADDTLQSNIDSEASTRKSVDDDILAKIAAVSESLATETSDRKAADTSLQGNIDSEATARSKTDTALTNSISSEKTAREEADNSILDKITSVNKALSTEQTQRANYDKNISDRLDSEMTNRVNSEKSLSDKIDTEITNRVSYDETLQSNIDTVVSNLKTETTNRTDADTAINNKVMFYADCATARNATAKVVSYNDFKLEKGAKIYVRFTSTVATNPTSGNFTLNVNGTGAKTVVDGKSNKTAVAYSMGSWFCNNYVHEFVYDGTNWVWMTRDNNTTYTGATLKTNAAKTGTGTTVTDTIAKSTTMDNAIGTLLNNDVALESSIEDMQTAWESFKGTSDLTLASIQEFMDNTNSSIESINGDIEEINNNLANLIIDKQYTSDSIDIPGNNQKLFHITIPEISGYKICSLIPYGTNHNDVGITSVDFKNNVVGIWARNMHTAQQTTSVTVRVLYVLAPTE